MKLRLKVHESSHVLYMPEALYSEGMRDELDAYANGVTLVLVKQGSTLEQIKQSLKLSAQEVEIEANGK